MRDEPKNQIHQDNEKINNKNLKKKKEEKKQPFEVPSKSPPATHDLGSEEVKVDTPRTVASFQALHLLLGSVKCTHPGQGVCQVMLPFPQPLPQGRDGLEGVKFVGEDSGMEDREDKSPAWLSQSKWEQM